MFKCSQVLLAFVRKSKDENVYTVQFSSVAQSCPTLCDPVDCNIPGFPVHHQLLKLAQTHVHWVGDTIQPSHPLSLKSITVSIIFQSICHEVMGLDAMILVFWMLSFKPTFLLSSLMFIKRLFSSSSLSAIRVVLSVYLRLLIFLPAFLIPACASSSLAFHMMYSAYKLNKHLAFKSRIFFSLHKCRICSICKLGNVH